jgi:hypothetical protein
MALKFSTAVRNARLDAIALAVGKSPILEIRSGEPSGLDDPGDVLAVLQLPSDWLMKAKNGKTDKKGSWEVPMAAAEGDAGHFRLCSKDGTPHVLGRVTEEGQGGEMEVKSTQIKAGQTVIVAGFSITDGNG